MHSFCQSFSTSFHITPSSFATIFVIQWKSISSCPYSDPVLVHVLQSPEHPTQCWCPKPCCSLSFVAKETSPKYVASELEENVSCAKSLLANSHLTDTLVLTSLHKSLSSCQAEALLIPSLLYEPKNLLFLFFFFWFCPQSLVVMVMKPERPCLFQ